MAKTRSSRGERGQHRVVVSRRFDWIAVDGRHGSWMKSPDVISSSPTGVRARALLGDLGTCAPSPAACRVFGEFFRSLAADFVQHLARGAHDLLMVSIMCTGMRMVRA